MNLSVFINNVCQHHTAALRTATLGSQIFTFWIFIFKNRQLILSHQINGLTTWILCFFSFTGIIWTGKKYSSCGIFDYHVAAAFRTGYRSNHGNIAVHTAFILRKTGSIEFFLESLVEIIKTFNPVHIVCCNIIQFAFHVFGEFIIHQTAEALH